MLAFASSAVAADPPAKPNRLAKESSPYLLQHARNPVDWYPWGPEALEKAKKEGKLIFLSVGYSACHWCHVMEKETFENAAVAKALNESFVCIKVDREERPDIDDVYLTALQVTGSNGGWPLSMFLTPDAKPIFGGTYFPPDDKKVNDEDTIPGFKSILAKVNELHRDKKKELYAQADAIAERTVEQLDRNARVVAVGALDKSVVEAAVASYQIDPVHGGFGSKARDFEGTKFPRAAALEFLYRQSRKKGNEELAKGVDLTLAKMAQGGIYDHLGGGFHRYSTERTWTVPHFEKMLYDNAQLVSLFAETKGVGGPKDDYGDVIDRTLAFVAREMTAPEGYFYSALDADSDGREGTFYVWTERELDAILGDSEDAKMFRKSYSLEAANFEKTKFIPRLHDASELSKTFPELRKKLFDARAKRNRPFLDTKLITGWNGQMVGAYARAAQARGFKPYFAAAEKAADFLLKTMRDKDGRLLRIYSAAPGEKATAKGVAFLDDYAFLIDGLLALHAATSDDRWLKEAVALQGLQDNHYADDKRGGYFNTPHDGEKLFARGKDGYDGAQPSGNGVACRNLYTLARLTKKSAYRDRAERCLQANAATLRTAPSGMPVMVGVLDAIFADGGFKTETAGPAVIPKNPTESADVVTAELKTVNLADGLQTFLVKIVVAKGWHVYANPVRNNVLADAATTIEFFIDGKRYEAVTKFPEGVLRKDAKTGDYRIYEGTTEIDWTVNDDAAQKGPVTVRVRVTACDEKNCLKPSTITAEVKK